MRALRRLVLAHSHMAALIYVAVLALRILIPTGYMVSSDHGRVTITLCSGVVEQPSMAMDMAGMDHAMPDHGKSKEHGKAEMPCAFSGLSTPVFGGADPVLLVVALALVAAMALRATPRTIVASAPYLRPPLRGPPLFR
ncbi:hypothetical protein KZ820_20600 [Sphingomonas sp. RRHST34]|uniref:DUF2946 domain-containing protein n=2 Tax=Sphingomonas citri TaxID=2862499 RepID=A0ABS7BU73_9SPHN|nr:hypothetical protein [Sphingomonas citri]